MRPLLVIIFLPFLGLQLGLYSTETLWEELPAMPEGRGGMVAFTNSHNEPGYYGGTSWSDNVKRFHANGYVLSNDEWRELPSLSEPIAYASVAGDKNTLYASGGTTGTQLRPSILLLDTRTLKTSIVETSGNVCYYAGGALVNNVLYQLGGSRAQSPLAPHPFIDKFINDEWVKVTPLPEGALINPAVAALGNHIYIFGGGVLGEEGIRNTGSTYVFNSKDSSWVRLASLPSPRRGSVALNIPDIGIIIVGGYLDFSEFTSQVLLYDSEIDTFETLVDLPFGLLLPAVVYTGEWIYVVGGEDAPKHRSNRVFRISTKALVDIGNRY